MPIDLRNYAVCASAMALACAAPLAWPAAASAQTFAEPELFTPRPTGVETTLDYAYWDEALRYFVFRMGQSERRSAGKVAPITGTRQVFGHDSRLRLEGNRVAFSFLGPDQIAALSEYRQELQSIPSRVDLTSLSRNEQLAFWINLHNVTVIEQIAMAYPLQQPSRLKFGAEGAAFDVAKLITVNGVALSLHDIRTRIVYPNWNDARVMYGFFRGEIGGPSIQRMAFTGDNVSRLLGLSAAEFVNSLRGTEKRGRTLHVSTIYDEAAPFYFPDWHGDLPAHLQQFAVDEVKALISATSRVQASIYERDIADLAGGDKDPDIWAVSHLTDPKGYGFDVLTPPRRDRGVPRNISRLVQERDEKIERIVRRGKLRGIVTVLDQEPEPGAEVQ